MRVHAGKPKKRTSFAEIAATASHVCVDSATASSGQSACAEGDAATDYERRRKKSPPKYTPIAPDKKRQKPDKKKESDPDDSEMETQPSRFEHLAGAPWNPSEQLGGAPASAFDQAASGEELAVRVIAVHEQCAGSAPSHVAEASGAEELAAQIIAAYDLAREG